MQQDRSCRHPAGNNGSIRPAEIAAADVDRSKTSVKLHAFVPLVTYPDPNSDAVAANAVAAAKWLGANLE